MSRIEFIQWKKRMEEQSKALAQNNLKETSYNQFKKEIEEFFPLNKDIENVNTNYPNTPVKVKTFEVKSDSKIEEIEKEVT